MSGANPYAHYLSHLHYQNYDIAYFAYVGRLNRQILQIGYVRGRHLFAKPRGRKANEFTPTGTFNASNKNNPMDQIYVVKRVSSRAYIVFDRYLEIPMSEPCTLDEACQLCRNMNKLT